MKIIVSSHGDISVYLSTGSQVYVYLSDSSTTKRKISYLALKLSDLRQTGQNSC
jgi:hypothetical protein